MHISFRRLSKIIKLRTHCHKPHPGSSCIPLPWGNRPKSSCSERFCCFCPQCTTATPWQPCHRRTGQPNLKQIPVISLWYLNQYEKCYIPDAAVPNDLVRKTLSILAVMTSLSLYFHWPNWVRFLHCLQDIFVDSFLYTISVKSSFVRWCQLRKTTWKSCVDSAAFAAFDFPLWVTFCEWRKRKFEILGLLQRKYVITRWSESARKHLATTPGLVRHAHLTGVKSLESNDKPQVFASREKAEKPRCFQIRPISSEHLQMLCCSRYLFSCLKVNGLFVTTPKVPIYFKITMYFNFM